MVMHKIIPQQEELEQIQKLDKQGDVNRVATTVAGNNDIEEEKEVPSEHPNDLNKITPTRNGCNVTACKGFSFENMAFSGSPKERQDNRDELVESGFIVIDQRHHQEEIEKKHEAAAHLTNLAGMQGDRVSYFSAENSFNQSFSTLQQQLSAKHEVQPRDVLIMDKKPQTETTTLP